MSHKIGKNTLLLDNVSLGPSAAVGSKKEGEGPLGKYFDMIEKDPRFGKDTFEQGEIKMQTLARNTLLKKSNLSTEDIDYLFAGDLLNQCIATSFSARESEIPLIGLYGACSTFTQALGIASVFCDAGAKNCIAEASSHFCSAERQYRFPLEYGGQRPPTAQWTATAAGAALVKKGEAPPFIKAVTFGKIVDLGISDQNNMGAAMAPAAASTLSSFFRDTYTDPSDYDLILTGDLGAVGAKLLKETLETEGFFLGENYNDCGLLLFDREKQQVEAGASGCGCSASVLCGYAFEKLRKGEIKSLLAISTGALLSPTSTLQGETIPGIAHLVCLSNEKGGIF